MSEQGTVAAFTYGGYVRDAQGNPVSDVEVIATHRRDERGFGYIDVVKTDARGHFLINRERAMSGAYANRFKDESVRLQFRHPDHAFASLDGVQTYTPSDATNFTVMLPTGREITGYVLNQERQPVAEALVEIEFASDYEQRRGTTTDAEGRFTFRGLPDEAGTVRVLTTAPDQPLLTAQADVTATQTDIGTIVAAPIALPESTPVHELFGMKLLDVDDALQAAFHLPRPDGVLVLDPGSRGRELQLQRGDQFWLVGDAKVTNFADFTSKLLTLRTASNTSSNPGDTAGERVRVVWNFNRPDLAGTNTQYLQITSADLSDLAALQKN